MPSGMILLLIIAALVYFGAAQRVLDRMRLTDTQALLFISLMIAGSFINIPILSGRTEVAINVGGALVPFGIALFLLATADTGREKLRGIVGTLVTTGVIIAITRMTAFDPGGQSIIDPVWLFGIVAGIVGYLSGRSRRASFIAGTLGIILSDVVHLYTAITQNLPTTVAIGGAGVFDAIVVGGLLAVLLAELVGETRERLQGGPAKHNASELENDEFVEHFSRDERQKGDDEQ